MTRWQVVVADRLGPPADVEEAVFGDLAAVTLLQARSVAALRGQIEEADAILAWHELEWTEEVIAGLRRCRVIVRVGVGVDNVDLAAARRRGISVCHVPDYGTNDVADHALALLLALARGLVGNDRAARGGAWAWGLARSFRLTGRTLGIVGLGRIGTAVALRAMAFGMRVVYFDPYVAPGWDKALGVTRAATLAELAGSCDVISVHCPATAETRGMLGGSFFAGLRAGAILINTARGSIVDWAAFSSAFNNWQVAAAGFDVLPVEPADLADPLLKAWADGAAEVRDRLIVTPHCAFYSPEAVVELRRLAAEEALRVLLGEPPRAPVRGGA